MMNWMYIGITIIILISTIIVVKGFTLTKMKHKNQEDIKGTAVYDAGIFETLVLFSLSLLFKFVPYWLMRMAFIFLGLTILV